MFGNKVVGFDDQDILPVSAIQKGVAVGEVTAGDYPDLLVIFDYAMLHRYILIRDWRLRRLVDV